jgi:hypothetical protein
MNATIACLAGLGLVVGVAPAAAYVIDGLEGAPTANELASLKKGLEVDYRAAALTCSGPPCGPFNVFLGNHGNNYVYGQSGGAVEGMIALYQITRDPAVMDGMVYFADQMLAHRNDHYKTHSMYTGKVELCWPNKDPGPEYGYCGTEQGDVLGHITSVALEIVKSPSLWQRQTPVPDTMKFGATYLERARSYLAECRKTIDTFIIPELVDANDRFRYPDSDAFAALGSRYAGIRGRTVPWNQNTMLANGFLSIAMALDVLGEEPATVARYDTIVRTWVRALIDNGVTRGTVMGNPTYDWCYGSNDRPPACSEDIGHGGYDFWGVYRAYARPKLGFTMAEVVPFANTFRYLIMQGAGYAAKVNGTGAGGKVGSTWLYAAFLRHDLFQAVASPLVPAATAGDPDTAGRILWSKYMNSRNWQPEESYGAPPPAPSDGGSGIEPADAGAGAGGTGGRPSGGGGSGGAGGVTGAGGSGPATGGAGGRGDAAGGATQTGSGGSSEEDPGGATRSKGRSAGCALGGAVGGESAVALASVLLGLAWRRSRRRR